MRSNSRLVTSSLASSPLQRTSSKPISSVDLGFLLCAVEDEDRWVNYSPSHSILGDQGPHPTHQTADYVYLLAMYCLVSLSQLLAHD